MPFLGSLIYLLLIQNYMKHSNFQKFCQNHWTLMYNSWYCLGGSVVHASPGKKNSALFVFPSHKIIVKSSSTFCMKVWLGGENPARPKRANRPHSSPLSHLYTAVMRGQLYILSPEEEFLSAQCDCHLLLNFDMET